MEQQKDYWINDKWSMVYSGNMQVIQRVMHAMGWRENAMGVLARSKYITPCRPKYPWTHQRVRYTPFRAEFR